LPAKRASAGHCGSRPRPQACYGRLGSIGYSFVRASPGLAHAIPSGNSQANRSVRLGPLGGALMARPNCPDFPSAGIVTHRRVPGGDMMLKGTGRQHAPHPLTIDQSCLRETGPDPGKELVTGPNLFQRSRRMPTLIVDSSDQHRQLVVKLSCSSTVKRSRRQFITARNGW
jgi:hypothetical protein